MVKEVRTQMPRIGAKKLHHMLGKPLKELHVGRDKLLQILKANHMLVTPKRSYRKTTNSYHRFHKHKNLIANIKITHPEQVWVSDITYIGGRGNTYLALVTDAYSKKIMGYDLSDSLATEGTLRALRMADKQRQYKQGSLIHHSDRGLQYCSDDYQKLLKKKRITPSMTESYDPYANAVAERVNGILKQEFLLEDYHVDSKTMKLLVEDAIRIYNTKRPHYSCYMNTPEQMHKQSNVKIRTYKRTESCKASLATLC
jgi:putative transposase